MRVLISLLVLGLGWVGRGHTQGIAFFEGTWEQVLEKAREEEKPIFVDAYTTWCGPCKMMAQRVFPLEEVGALYNAHFISVQIDMETEAGLLFQQSYPVRAFPTLLYIDADGKLLKTVVGAQQGDALVQIGRGVLRASDQTEVLAAAYEKGDRSPELVYQYIRSLNKAGQSPLRIANEYIKGCAEPERPENLKIIYEATTEADSRVFESMVRYRSALNALFSVEKVEARIYQACGQTAKKALEYASADLLEEAKAKMGQHIPERAKAFSARMDMEWALRQQDEKAFARAVQLYAKNAVSEPAADLKSALDRYASHYPANEQVQSAVAALRKVYTGKQK